MKTLDTILAEQTTAAYEEQLEALLNPEAWSKETRDELMAKIRALAGDMAQATEDFVRNLLDTKLEDKSILHWKVLQQFIAAEIEMLLSFRNDLDVTDETALADLPVDYNWLNSAIKERYQEMGKLTLELDNLSTAQTVEEL